MLVLSRKRDERILIGNEIEVKVLSVQGNRVRLGITCPDGVRILRSEIQPMNAAPGPEGAMEFLTS